jgi:tetratricopeptide (TPR) repeat protein
VLVTSAAHAEPPKSGEVDSAVLAHFENGSRFFQTREYDKAISEFREAYAISHEPELLFNMAQAYYAKGAGSCTKSVELYREYLNRAPDAPNRTNVERFIADRQDCAKTETASAAAKEPEHVTRVPPSGPPSAQRTWAYAMLGVGAVGGVLAGVMAAFAFHEDGALADACTADGDCPPSEASRIDRYDTFRGLAVAGGGVAVLGLAGGLVLLLWKGPRRAPSSYAPVRASVVAKGVLGLRLSY